MTLYQTPAPPEPPKIKKRPPFYWLLLALIGFVALVCIYNSDFLEFDKEGNPILSPVRQAKMEKELEELEHAEQYALLVSRDGDYACFSCPGKTTIFLGRGMVYKYGVTRKGEAGRYGKWHIERGLIYQAQFEGPLQECLRQEKLKIYHYVTLPENLSRDVPLIRPPGNKQDN